jgi:predicted MFS family arabinose efflux permease
MMSLGASYLLFFIGCAIFGFYWNFYLTLQIGLVSRADDTGRGIVLCGVAPSIGVIIGSFMGGMLVHGSTFLPLAQAGAVLCITGIACTLASMTRMKANDVSNPAPHAAS